MGSDMRSVPSLKFHTGGVTGALKMLDVKWWTWNYRTWKCRTWNSRT